LDAHDPIDAVIGDLQEAITRKPDMYQARWGLAIAYTGYCTPTLALDAALAEAQEVVRLRPGDSKPLWLLGQIYADRKEWDKSADAHRGALRLDPENADAHVGLGKALEKLGRENEAKAAFARAVEVRQKVAAGKPKDPALVQDELGTAYFFVAQYDQAIAAYKEALRLSPNNPEYHRHLAGAYYWQGKPADGGPSTKAAEAIAEYETAIRLNPYDSLARSILAGVYREIGRDDDALREYQEALRLFPCDADGIFLLASQYDKMGLQKEAEETFRRLTPRAPAMAFPWQYRASMAYSREEYAEAVENYRTGLRADPEDPNLHYGLGNSLYALGRYEEAEAEYRLTIELLPEDAPSYAAWGDALAKLERRAEAIAAYQKSLQLDSTAYLTWLSLGLQYELAQNWQEAEKAYAEAVKLQPDDALSRSARGQMLQRLNRLDEAVREYEAAVTLDPGQWIYRESLALLYAALNRPDDAVAAAEATIKLKPDSALAHLIIAGVSEDKGNKERARAEYELALRYVGENAGLKKLAEDGLKRVGQ
ncbi:MAG: tetratricopeptide repeat protein, partial [Anaerolineae bacterium]|nr:tetratricopeptide repeat protein [Anaerolineae bacterium]